MDIGTMNSGEDEDDLKEQIENTETVFDILEHLNAKENDLMVYL